MMTSLGLFTLAVLVISVGGETHYEVEERLRRSLFQHYNNNIAPLTSINDNITLHIGLSLLSIDELDVTKEVLTTQVLLTMRWRDVRLTWDPSEYSGQHLLSLATDVIWTPDLVPYNKAGTFYPPSDSYPAVLYNDGDVTNIPHVTLTTSCSVDLRYFPFDQHSCEVRLGSWTYNADVLPLKADHFQIDQFEENNIWKLTNYSQEIVSKKYPCCPETYHYYLAKLVLRRRTGLLMNMYVVPAVCIGLVLPSVFLLPTTSSTKLILGSGLLIGQVLLLDMIVEILPVNAMTVPRLAVYYLSNIVLISLALVLSAIIACLWNRSGSDAALPRIVNKIFVHTLGRLLCVGGRDYLSNDEDIDADKGRINSDWCRLAAVLDRLFVVIFLVVAVITLIALLTYANHD